MCHGISSDKRIEFPVAKLIELTAGYVVSAIPSMNKFDKICNAVSTRQATKFKMLSYESSNFSFNLSKFIPNPVSPAKISFFFVNCANTIKRINSVHAFIILNSCSWYAQQNFIYQNKFSCSIYKNVYQLESK